MAGQHGQSTQCLGNAGSVLGGRWSHDIQPRRGRHAGSLGSFAAREIPKIQEVYGVCTIGQIAKLSHEQIRGPQCRYAGNKTLEWIMMVCRAFKIEPPR